MSVLTHWNFFIKGRVAFMLPFSDDLIIHYLFCINYPTGTIILLLSLLFIFLRNIVLRKAIYCLIIFWTYDPEFVVA